jgi:hypothetical protein
LVTRNPWRDDAAQVVSVDAQGHEVYYVVPVVARNEMGFDVTAPVIGEAFKRHAETPAQVARKEAAKLAMGVNTQEELDAARKAKAIPFGGQLKPYQHIDDAQLPTYLPKRGTELDVNLPTIELRPLTYVAAAKLLRVRVPAWSAESMSWLKSNYPNGVPEVDLDGIAATLNKPARQALRVVGGE